MMKISVKSVWSRGWKKRCVGFLGGVHWPEVRGICRVSGRSFKYLLLTVHPARFSAPRSQVRVPPPPFILYIQVGAKPRFHEFPYICRVLGCSKRFLGFSNLWPIKITAYFTPKGFQNESLMNNKNNIAWTRALIRIAENIPRECWNVVLTPMYNARTRARGNLLPTVTNTTDRDL